MTDAIEFGPEIKRGSPLWPEGQERPVWLADDVRVLPFSDGLAPWSQPYLSREIHVWRDLEAIKLPHDHPASIAQRWNDDNPDHPDGPFNRIHLGSEQPPADYAGGACLYRDGTVARYSDLNDWLGAGCGCDIIAYRSKPSEQTADDEGPDAAITAACDVLAGRGDGTYDEALDALRALLNLIRPESHVERFKRENPGLSADELLEKALAR